MKKAQAFCCTVMLSTALVGNTFAFGTSGSTLSILTIALQNLTSFFSSGGDSCPVRQCTTCPNNGTDNDNDKQCRPPEA